MTWNSHLRYKRENSSLLKAKWEKVVKKIVFSLLLLAPAAYAIEPYRAQEIQSYQGSGIEPYQAKQVQKNRSNSIGSYKAEQVESYQGSGIESYQGEQVQSYQSSSIEPGNVEMVKPYANDQGQQRKAATKVQSQTDRAPENSRRPAPADNSNGAKSVIGLWQTNIPGVVYTTPSGLAGYDTLHVSSGASGGLLRINENGTYTWNSYGGKKGKWVSTADSEYPIEIIDTVENRRWRVGYSGSKGVLYLWSGSIFYEGRKAAIKKK